MIKLVLTAAAVLTLAAASGADARPVSLPEPPKTVVRYDDLDLRDPQGARAMLSRIRHAAATVCRASPFTSGTAHDAVERLDRCRRDSVARAVAELNASQVTAAFEAKSMGRRIERLP